MIPNDAPPEPAMPGGPAGPVLRRWYAATRPAADPMPPHSALRRWLVDVLVVLFVSWGDVQALFRQGDGVPRWVPGAVGIGVMLSLLVRRRRPIAVFAVQAAWFAALPVLLPDKAALGAGMVIALYALAIRRPIRWVLGAGAACVAAFGWLVFLLTVRDPRGVDEGAIFFAIVFVMTATIVVTVVLTVARQTVVKRQARLSVEQALRDERVAIARELHDIVAHAVSIMVLQAAGAKAVLEIDPRRSAEALEVISDTGSQSLDELGRLLQLLRSATGGPQEAAHPPVSDFGALGALVEQSRAAGLPVEVEVSGEPGTLDPSVSLTAYRLVQEALTNTRKHAGPRAWALVRIAWTDDRLHLAVEDRSPERPPPGTAPAVPSTGVGLLGLRERVTTVGGELNAGPSADGFRIEASLPARRRVVAGDVSVDDAQTRIAV